MKLNIKDTFNKELPADKETENSRRQVNNACFSYVTPKSPSNPELVHYASFLANDLGIANDVQTKEFLDVFSGNSVYPETNPFAMCYGGHQFGNWAGQLGDGRAINLFEIEANNKHWALQLKGAGETPYSRTADELAVLRSSVREHLCSEAMHSLGVPTTRSLALILSGDEVLRDILYNGNPKLEKGAIVTRVAPSFIRFGNFQIFASRRDNKTLKELTDYTIAHYFPNIKSEGKEKYLDFYQEVVNKSLEMVVEWQRVGFVHGVMNTDNMSILGLTIDYGPYGWLENFDPDWTPNTTDRQNKRYRFRNQPDIILWNLVQLGNALYPLIEDIPAMETILTAYNKTYDTKYHKMMAAKLGLSSTYTTENHDELINLLTQSNIDMTIFFRNLSSVTKLDTPKEAFTKIKYAFYNIEELPNEIITKWEVWLKSYLEMINAEEQTDSERKASMNRNNPKYVLRNYMAQLAIESAEKGDYSLINELYLLLQKPYEEQSEHEKWFAKRPDWALEKVGCSMLSCSS